MKAKTTLGLAVLMTGWGMASPAFGQTAPSFPSMEAVLEARAPLVRPDLQAKIAGFEAQLSGNSLFHALVTDRVEGILSLNRGLTVLSETDNGAGVVNDTTSDQLRLSGAITYTIGLKELTKNRSSRAAIRRALAVAEAELELAVVGDRVAMLTKLNDYLEARASFEKSTGGRVHGAAAPAQGVDVKSGYLMRELALEILVLIGKDGEPLFEDWSRFRPQGARLQATTLVLR